MKIFLSSFLLIFAAKSSFAAIEIKTFYNDTAKEIVLYPFSKDYTLNCNVTGTATKLTMDWLKGNESVTKVDDLKGRVSTPDPIQLPGGGYAYYLKIKNAQYTDAGHYSCVALNNGVEEGRANIHFVAKVAVRIKTANINVVEEEKLRIECQALGNPEIKWVVNTTRYFGEEFDSSTKNVTIENFKDEYGNEIANGAFILSSVEDKDRGDYTCIGVNRFYENDVFESSACVRVKDKYAALWPFLGICAEVVVLCAVIIIYEKKRNKTELEESDTDQSPDQKNTPDHGKESNLRHRQ